jgi:hypothetical protein
MISNNDYPWQTMGGNLFSLQNVSGQDFANGLDHAENLPVISRSVLHTAKSAFLRLVKNYPTFYRPVGC